MCVADILSDLLIRGKHPEIKSPKFFLSQIHEFIFSKSIIFIWVFVVSVNFNFVILKYYGPIKLLLRGVIRFLVLYFEVLEPEDHLVRDRIRQ